MFELTIPTRRRYDRRLLRHALLLPLVAALGWTGCGVIEPDEDAPHTDLEIDLVADGDQRDAGEDVTYTLTVRNLGPVPASGVIAGSALPEALTYVSHEATAGTFAADSGIWRIGDLAVDGIAVLTLSTTVETGFDSTVARHVVGVSSTDQNDTLDVNNVDEHSLTIAGSNAPPPPPPPPPPPGVTFSSDWSTATGNSVAAVTDGGRWPGLACSNFHQTLNVVPGNTVGFTLSPNVLRIQDLGASICGMLEQAAAVPASTTHWGRLYFRNDIQASGTHNHVGTYNAIGRVQVTWWSRQGLPSGGFFIFLRTYYFGNGSSSAYPFNRWAPTQPLANNTWYRYEWHMEFVTATSYRIWPRVYAMGGTQPLLDADDFVQSDYPSSGTHTLASYYAAGNTFGFSDPALSRRLGLGNEGPPSSSNSGQYWYHARVALSTAGWIGQ